MKTKHLIITAACALAAYAMSSCSMDPYIITAEEEYTRNFIKTFGLIDPKQDWNMAQEAKVTVNVGEGASSVKVYCKVDEKYYIVANLSNMKGSFDVPIDIPEGCNDLMVKVDGKKYFTTAGGNVTATGMAKAKSRYGTEGGLATVTITDDYMTFNTLQLAPILKSWTKTDGKYNPEDRWVDYYNGEGLLRENKFEDDDPRAYGLVPERANTATTENYNNPLLVKDFWFGNVDKDGITIYPMYWNTSRSTHTIGIYYFVDSNNKYVAPGTPGATLHKEDIFQDKNVDPEDQLRVMTGTNVYITTPIENVSDTEKGAIYDAIKAAYDDTFPSLSEMTTDKFRGTFHLFDRKVTNAIAEAYKTLHHTFTNNGTTYNLDEAIMFEAGYYPNDLDDTANGKFADAKLVMYLPDWNYSFGNNPYDPDGTDDKIAQAKGINIKFLDSEGNARTDIVFGMYLKTEGSYYFSQSQYNVPANGTKNNEKVINQPFAATFRHQSSGRQFFSFEDAEDYIQAWDLNDLVFRMDGNYSTYTTDENTNQTWVTKDYEETEKTISWLIAAEDLGTTDDFDFNDVIFSIQVVTESSTTTETSGTTDEGGNSETTGSTSTNSMRKKVTLQALAAGGTLPVWLHYYNASKGKDYVVGPNEVVETTTAASNPDEYEWHKWFNGSVSTKMINTNAGTTVKKPSSIVMYTSSTDITVTDGAENIDVQTSGVLDENFTVAKYSVTTSTDGGPKRVNGFYITVNEIEVENTDAMTDVYDGDTRIVSNPEPGKAPQMFLIEDIGHIEGKGWYWPTERSHILETYPTFKDWVGNSHEATDWHKNPKSPKICRPAEIPGVHTSSSSSGSSTTIIPGGGTTVNNKINITQGGTLDMGWGSYPLVKISPDADSKAFGAGTTLSFKFKNGTNYLIYDKDPTIKDVMPIGHKEDQDLGGLNNTTFTVSGTTKTKTLWILLYNDGDEVKSVTAEGLVNAE